MSSVIHITILEKELEWLKNNSGLIQRLKRAVIREYLNSRVNMISKELDDHRAAKKLLEKDKATRVLIKKSKEIKEPE